MKLTVVGPPEVIPDTAARSAIEYLDSSTDYREVLPRQKRMQATWPRGQRKRRNDVEDFVLVFVPFLLVGIAAFVLCWK